MLDYVTLVIFILLYNYYKYTLLQKNLFFFLFENKILCLSKSSLQNSEVSKETIQNSSPNLKNVVLSEVVG